jgi:hypothetical protein
VCMYLCVYNSEGEGALPPHSGEREREREREVTDDPVSNSTPQWGIAFMYVCMYVSMCIHCLYLDYSVIN